MPVAIILKMLPVGATRIVSGKVELFDRVPNGASRIHDRPEELRSKFEPIYPLTAGLQNDGAGDTLCGDIDTRFGRMD